MALVVWQAHLLYSTTFNKYSLHNENTYLLEREGVELLNTPAKNAPVPRQFTPTSKKMRLITIFAVYEINVLTFQFFKLYVVSSRQQYGKAAQ